MNIEEPSSPEPKWPTTVRGWIGAIVGIAVVLVLLTTISYIGG